MILRDSFLRVRKSPTMNVITLGQYTTELSVSDAVANFENGMFKGKCRKSDINCVKK
jgi:hypothetical protein